MRMATAWLGVVLCAAAASEVRADPYCCPRPPAPDACGPGTYCVNPCTCAVYGPCYWVRPPWQPDMLCPPGRGGPGGAAGPGGMGPGGPGGPYGIAAFPVHPFARSPRDYFMDP